MLAKRIIPCLDVKDGRVVKGVHFVNLRDAGDPVAYSAAGDHFFNAGDYEAAVFAYTKLNQAKPDTPPLLIALAQSQYRAGDVDAARSTLHHLRAIQPNNFVANNSLVDLDIESGQLDDALAFADQLKSVVPDQAAQLTSKVLMKQNEGGQAIAVLEQALAETPSPAITRTRRIFGTRETTAPPAVADHVAESDNDGGEGR